MQREREQPPAENPPRAIRKQRHRQRIKNDILTLDLIALNYENERARPKSPVSLSMSEWKKITVKTTTFEAKKPTNVPSRSTKVFLLIFFLFHFYLD